MFKFLKKTFKGAKTWVSKLFKPKTVMKPKVMKPKVDTIESTPVNNYVPMKWSGEILENLRKYSNNQIQLGHSRDYIQMPDMNNAINQLLKIGSREQDWEEDNAQQIIALHHNINMYEVDYFYSDDEGGRDYTLLKMVENFNKLLENNGLSLVPSANVIRFGKSK